MKYTCIICSYMKCSIFTTTEIDPVQVMRIEVILFSTDEVCYHSYRSGKISET